MACFQCNNRKGDLTAEQFMALGYDPRTDTDPRPRLSEARMEMWRKADAQRMTPMPMRRRDFLLSATPRSSTPLGC